MAMTVLDTLCSAAVHLETAGIDTARRDAEVLLCHVIQKNRAWVLTHGKDALEDRDRTSFEEAIHRREKREPLQYITGLREFWGLEFKVTPAVLIPRPETEFIVESALATIADRNKQVTILDLCTGSGCIAVCLAKELPAARIFATDASDMAIDVARENAQRHGVSDRIMFAIGDLFEPLTDLAVHGQIDVIATNPPYIPVVERHSLQPEVRDFEPAQALFAGHRGTELAEKIIRTAPAYLRKNGILIMEMGMGQAKALERIFIETKCYDPSKRVKDLAGIDRVIIARKI